MKRVLREQAGIALPAALGVLVVIGLLSSSLFAVSLRLNDTSTASRDGKRALAAADSGLEAAMFRMNVAGFQDTDQCFTTEGIDPASGTDPETGTSPAADECAGIEGDLGNDSSYTYYVTPELQDGDVCAGLPVHHSDADGEVTVTQRCVTSVGEVNGERRRIQARVASYSAHSPWKARPASQKSASSRAGAASQRYSACSDRRRSSRKRRFWNPRNVWLSERLSIR
jgi:hypothetical protein